MILRGRYRPAIQACDRCFVETDYLDLLHYHAGDSFEDRFGREETEVRRTERMLFHQLEEASS